MTHDKKVDFPHSASPTSSNVTLSSVSMSDILSLLYALYIQEATWVAFPEFAKENKIVAGGK